MKLPQIPYDVGKSQSEIVSTRGINFSDRIQDGDLRDCMNLSARRYPYITPRRARVQVEQYSGISAMTAHGSIVAVQGTNLICDGKVVGTVMAGEKQFAAVNTKMVIFPDKKYLDLNTKDVKELAPVLHIAEGSATFSAKSISMTETKPTAEKTETISSMHANDSGNQDWSVLHVMTYSHMEWRDDGWVFSGEVERTFGVSSPSLGVFGNDDLRVGDIAPLEADGNGVLSLNIRRSVIEQPRGSGPKLISDSGYAENAPQYYARIDEIVEEHKYTWPVDDYWTTITYTIFDGAVRNPQLTRFFEKGDRLKISGCTAHEENNTAEDVYLQVESVDDLSITFKNGNFEEGTEAAKFTISRPAPDLDFICAIDNRLWGCSNEDKTIYASALGSPTNFYAFDGLSTDSYAVAVGSEGDFTGCAAYSNSVLFWKEAKLHKMLGNTPKEYAMYVYNLEGLKAGCHKSQQIINEVLYYAGLHGIYAYTGGTPTLISSCFGDKRFTDAVAGTDGDSYYLSVLDENGTAHLLVYETLNRLWLKEDDTRVIDFARIGKDLYFLDQLGDVWLADGRKEDPDVEWMAQFTPFYETLGGRKAYSKLILRLELPKGSFLAADIRFDGGVWKECSKVVGREHDAVTLRIPVNRCDKFEIRLRGKGPCTVLSVMREFTVGSDV